MLGLYITVSDSKSYQASRSFNQNMLKKTKKKTFAFQMAVYHQNEDKI